jgi:hypothetical protein
MSELAWDEVSPQEPPAVIPLPGAGELLVPERPALIVPGAAPAGTPRIRWRIRERVEDVSFRETLGYDITIQVWVNPPDDLVASWGASQASTSDILADVVRGWDIADEAGQLVPVSSENIAHLPSDLFAELNHEFWERRNAPLAQQRTRWQSATSKESEASSTPPTPSSSTPSA